ncbi:bifunctional proline dehydrogenase/L-glutamate gamma-semialdehyde dehydrogenase PutA [Blastomonas sp. AAP53]|uniref:bifunctional proline dehydrogenase/L-glutamate gamma-semialdehyde dehydrogenase PutA n=1 Tax=Blastomonas sp. AAP53 TaxID=1248760 RepID=UPI0002EEAAE3|nr:bifunctional proline dehydrogenase/L-glutamate gamma-semialdehyde dehydrogenase PutA [Blastomonas sp. AAP53]
MTDLLALRDIVRAHHRADEGVVLDTLTANYAPSPELRARIRARAVRVVEDVRAASGPTLMESFLGQYGLSSDEGLALMTLAEALLRVPDAETIDDLIEDKISPANWREHFGKSEHTLVNASTFALSMTQSVLEGSVSKGPLDALRSAIKRLGEPVIRVAVRRAMKELGNQFVLGEDMDEALKRSRKWAAEGATFSYDMLGEAALTFPDADRYFASYMHAIRAIADAAKTDDMRTNPGLSIKLSALYPRYEMSKADECVPALADRVLELARAARDARIGLNIDAEEAYRLGMSLDIIKMVLSDSSLAGWDGLGVVVQAFGKRASFVIDWLYGLAESLDRKIMVRLVKGAYWDSEIKRAQVDGVPDFPVFTSKAATDISYICCAAQLLRLTDRIYPQFATHNAHSVAAILEMAGNRDDFEFQRLHGMGEPLHGALLRNEKVRSRIYAPVGRHKELLAYLVRRLLENGANSSFVNQLANHAVPAEAIAADPFEQLETERAEADRKIIRPNALYAPSRINSHGWDLANRTDLNAFLESRKAFADKQWHAAPLIVGAPSAASHEREVFNPAQPDMQIGTVRDVTAEQAASAIAAARCWDAPVTERADALNRAAHHFETHHGEIFALLAREAGKSAPDAIAELREAVDFLRYYAAQALADPAEAPRGIITCISPWNFPLAIFTGQIAAALAAGNAVLAKPAEQTPLIAHLATRLLHEAGVPAHTLQLLPGPGKVIGSALTSDAAIAGTCFTGSTATAQAINRAMAEHCAPDAMLIAETGGLNAMIVDSTALPEQAVRDIVASAFQSAGQRCSALRLLYVQRDIADSLKEMLFGAMDALSLGDPWWLANDVGPVIDPAAREKIAAHIEAARRDGRLLKQLDAPDNGWFVGPAAIAVDGIEDLAEEIFGPVLHIATFEAGEIDALIDRINARGYGLTFGLQTRIDSRVDQVTARIHAGNMYINRNQIGAVVGAQPFGGEGLSGTGPKAGGPRYLPRFAAASGEQLDLPPLTRIAARAQVEAALAALPRVTELPLDTMTMPGPTGESNVLSTYARGRVLCLGPTVEAAMLQAQIAQSEGCASLVVVPGAKGPHAIDGFIERADLTHIAGFDAVAAWSTNDDQRAIRKALAARDGAILPLFTETHFAQRCVHERHVCIDTTAAGGNVSLLA